MLHSCLYVIIIAIGTVSSQCYNLDGTTAACCPARVKNMDELIVSYRNSDLDTEGKLKIGYEAMIQCLNPLIENNHLSTEQTLEIYCSSKLSSVKACVHPYMDLLLSSSACQKQTDGNFVRKVFEALLKFGCRKEDDKYMLIEFKKYSVECFDGTSNKLSGLMQCMPGRKQILESSTRDMCQQLHSIERCIKEKALACFDNRIKHFFDILIKDVNDATPCKMDTWSVLADLNKC